MQDLSYKEERIKVLEVTSDFISSISTLTKNLNIPDDIKRIMWFEQICVILIDFVENNIPSESREEFLKHVNEIVLTASKRI